MRYQEWIKAKEELSAADRQAFEHELQDNPRLQAEQAAVNLMDELLGTAAQELSEQAITGRAETAVPRRAYLLVSVLTLLVLSVGAYWMVSSTAPKPDTPAVEVAPQEQADPQLTEPRPFDTEQQQVAPSTPAPVADPPQVRKEPEPVAEKAVAAPAIAKVKSSAKARQQSVELDQPVEEAEEVVAEEIITLKPGFHAKAGTRFSARVEAESVLRR